MHEFLLCECKSQDFGQRQKIVARSHDHETVTFRNSIHTLVDKMIMIIKFWTLFLI